MAPVFIGAVSFRNSAITKHAFDVGGVTVEVAAHRVVAHGVSHDHGKTKVKIDKTTISKAETNSKRSLLQLEEVL